MRKSGQRLNAPDIEKAEHSEDEMTIGTTESGENSSEDIMFPKFDDRHFDLGGQGVELLQGFTRRKPPTISCCSKRIREI